MKRHTPPTVLGLGLVVALAVTAAPAASEPAGPPPSPLPTLLPTLKGGNAFAAGINEAGLVVGSSDRADGTYRAVIWRDGEIRRLPGLARGASSQANAVDDRGRVVGMAWDAEGDAHAVAWRRGRVRDLGVVGAFGSNATAVSRAGVVGTAFHVDGFAGRRAFVRSPGSEPVRLDLPPGSSADAVNDAGTVVGTYAWRDFGDPAFPEHQAYVVVDGTVATLGTLGGPGSVATDVNAADQVVGTTSTADDELVGFVWSDGRMARLPDAGIDSPNPAAISDSGHVVGTVGTTSRALWWERYDAEPVPLPAPEDTDGTAATDLNETGTVVGHTFRVDDSGFHVLPVVWG